MKPQFERYDAHARRALFFARYLAQCEGDELIEPRHLLVGLLWDDDGNVRRILERFSANPASAFVAARDRARSQQPKAGPREIPFSRETKDVLLHAVAEADNLHDETIRCDHLLLGILREGESDAAIALTNLGASLQALRDAVGLRPDNYLGQSAIY